MSQCPVCSTPIENSFGLVECPGCKKILFADFNGDLAVHNEEEIGEQLSAEASFEEEASPMEPQATDILEVSEAGEWGFEAPAAEATSEDSEPFVIEDPIIEPEVQESEPVEEEAIFEEISTTKNLPEVEPSVGAIAEINRFANSNDSSLKNGQWLYTLTINGIDTEDLREEVIEYLRDPKLGVPHELLNFDLPTLILKDLNAVKASVIVSRIKHLPVEMSWEQRSVIQDSGAEV